MEPFTTEEEASLVGRLDALSVSSLESYIGSAKNSLGNHSLALTWRPRIEFALRHAELALVKAVAAAALVEAAYAQCDTASWRWEAWTGWTAWRR